MLQDDGAFPQALVSFTIGVPSETDIHDGHISQFYQIYQHCLAKNIIHTNFNIYLSIPFQS